LNRTTINKLIDQWLNKPKL